MIQPRRGEAAALQHSNDPCNFVPFLPYAYSLAAI
jgi:hypothetical protein